MDVGYKIEPAGGAVARGQRWWLGVAESGVAGLVHAPCSRLAMTSIPTRPPELGPRRPSQKSLFDSYVHSPPTTTTNTAQTQLTIVPIKGISHLSSTLSLPQPLYVHHNSHAPLHPQSFPRIHPTWLGIYPNFTSQRATPQPVLSTLQVTPARKGAKAAWPKVQLRARLGCLPF